MGRRAERTYFNTEYMPELEEDTIDTFHNEHQGEIPLGDITTEMDAVIYQDRVRFYRVCRKHNYDCAIIKKESRRKHPDF